MWDNEGSHPVVVVPFIRRMKKSDLKKVAEIESVSFPRPWPVSSYRYELTENPFAYYIVACRGDTVVGFCGCWFIADEAHIITIAVHPAFRRQGIGRAMLLHVKGQLPRFGITRVALEVRVSNTQAQSLYGQFGFVVVGVRKFYYVDNNEDAILMNLELEGEGDRED
ncbi:ribosomal protein S18-alanine N-acetyltransferase [Pasteuria penetrans]|uniref:ribosomal protein S18-alanine N-acetyltransferase n=1 Tax=Pasteuria penetrans TaxID=86005 RepID=UPI001FECC076|nr:ribosomal protein S18-alanine N-acetyltransferase [Pasteuria penetrans]